MTAKTKGSRGAQPREVYYRLYYDAEKKAAVQAALVEARTTLGRKLTRSESMSISRQVVDKMYNESDASVHAAVQQQLAKEKVLAAVPADTPEGGSSHTPQEYQAYVLLSLQRYILLMVCALAVR